MWPSRRDGGFPLRSCQAVEAASAAVAHLRSRLGRIIRDIRRKIEGQSALEEAFAPPPGRATQIRSRQQRQRGWKLCSLNAPEMEGIGKGKAVAPCEFGVKASIVTINLSGSRRPVCAARQPDVRLPVRWSRCTKSRRFFISRQRRGDFRVIKRELRRRSAIEPVIGHLSPRPLLPQRLRRRCRQNLPLRPLAKTSAASSLRGPSGASPLNALIAATTCGRA